MVEEYSSKKLTTSLSVYLSRQA